MEANVWNDITSVLGSYTSSMTKNDISDNELTIKKLEQLKSLVRQDEYR